MDPAITLDNAEYQLDRVSSAWAKDTKRDQVQVRSEIDQMVQADADAPVGGLFGEKFVIVLQLNLSLRNKYGQPQ